jgi:hypothetical protein
MAGGENRKAATATGPAGHAADIVVELVVGAARRNSRGAIIFAQALLFAFASPMS